LQLLYESSQRIEIKAKTVHELWFDLSEDTILEFQFMLLPASASLTAVTNWVLPPKIKFCLKKLHVSDSADGDGTLQGLAWHRCGEVPGKFRESCPGCGGGISPRTARAVQCSAAQRSAAQRKCGAARRVCSVREIALAPAPALPAARGGGGGFSAQLCHAPAPAPAYRDYSVRRACVC
jgi:hypothetical protein